MNLNNDYQSQSPTTQYAYGVDEEYQALPFAELDNHFLTNFNQAYADPSLLVGTQPVSSFIDPSAVPFGEVPGEFEIPQHSYSYASNRTLPVGSVPGELFIPQTSHPYTTTTTGFPMGSSSGDPGIFQSTSNFPSTSALPMGSGPAELTNPETSSNYASTSAVPMGSAPDELTIPQAAISTAHSPNSLPTPPAECTDPSAIESVLRDLESYATQKVTELLKQFPVGREGHQRIVDGSISILYGTSIPEIEKNITTNNSKPTKKRKLDDASLAIPADFTPQDAPKRKKPNRTGYKHPVAADGQTKKGRPSKKDLALAAARAEAETKARAEAEATQTVVADPEETASAMAQVDNNMSDPSSSNQAPPPC
ncbi:hypothetical protein CROQUDRAFT_716807 [Cronartium quercuum f. sp. fusiforme G11]|uniref:Uncharacterized protein n=1 Tax=Cronartium quercuum f. sp. fusiforme G11 TaxID=708437 RepID=A0A9P6NDH4_9BASI|nr:hypothetical protein CROQUDRAFT_716807 [Cronartium quercuum f. sp. fusiforme G11]